MYKHGGAAPLNGGPSSVFLSALFTSLAAGTFQKWLLLKPKAPATTSATVFKIRQYLLILGGVQSSILPLSG